VCYVECTNGERRIVGSSFVRSHTVCLFVCLFVGIKPKKLYSTSCVGREVIPLGVITHGQRHEPVRTKDSGTYH